MSGFYTYSDDPYSIFVVVFNLNIDCADLNLFAAIILSQWLRCQAPYLRRLNHLYNISHRVGVFGGLFV